MSIFHAFLNRRYDKLYFGREYDARNAASNVEWAPYLHCLDKMRSIMAGVCFGGVEVDDYNRASGTRCQRREETASMA